MYLAATYAHLGRIDDATAAADKMNALRREQGINSFRADMLFVWYFKEKGDENRLRDGLSLLKTLSAAETPNFLCAARRYVTSVCVWQRVAKSGGRYGR
jgi:hypothetical protein